MKLNITVDNRMRELYVDGVPIPQSQLPNGSDWKKVDTVDIPGDTRVIAVKGEDVSVSSFIS